MQIVITLKRIQLLRCSMTQQCINVDHICRTGHATQRAMLQLETAQIAACSHAALVLSKQRAEKCPAGLRKKTKWTGSSALVEAMPCDNPDKVQH